MVNALDWDTIVEDLGPRLYRYFRVRFNTELADDLSQETLIRLVRKVDDGKFDPTRGSLRMLAFGIAHYVALESKTPDLSEQIENWEETLESDCDIEQIVISSSIAHKVREHMGTLPNIEQQILSLYIDDEMTIFEISMILQMPEGTIKSHIHRAKRRLTETIRREGVE